MTLDEVFRSVSLVELAGTSAYARGVVYHRDGRVDDEELEERRVRATVRGSVPYKVELWVDGREPGWSCTCPAAEDGSFCKHCVAVALLIDRNRADPWTEPDGTNDEDVDLAGYLSGLERDRLIELVLEASESDRRLHERLRAEALAARGDGPDLASWRRRIDTAFAPYGDFVPYREAGGWAQGVGDAIDTLDELRAAGHPDAVAVLAEHAHRRADDAMQYVDDSDGWLTDISKRLGTLHLRACAQGSPDPVELARRLVDLELTSELDGFHRAAARYVDVLGEDGLAEYRRLVEPRWEEVAEDTEGWSSERFRLREAMTAVALARGDPDELIRIRRHDLITPDDYLEIARSLAAASRADEAIEWGRRGLEECADRTWQTPPLRDFLAELLRERGNETDALDLYWDAFAGSPSLPTYRGLLEEAGDDATVWKERAIAELRSRVAEPQPGDDTRRGPLSTTPAGALVEILAYEGHIDSAWEAASEHGCDDRMWLTLARAREATHPLDAIGVYEREVFAQIDEKKNHTYKAAVDLMARVRRLADDAGRPELFESLLDRVRAEHKAKRNLRALLDEKGW